MSATISDKGKKMLVFEPKQKLETLVKKLELVCNDPAKLERHAMDERGCAKGVPGRGLRTLREGKKNLIELKGKTYRRLPVIFYYRIKSTIKS